ncbi:MAG: Ig-like domain-containing protein [Brevefilum sp.]|nr:Ig-like domain-containing protein [Brevefilum sp.]
MKFRHRYLPWLLSAVIFLTAAFVFLRLSNRVQPLGFFPETGEQISIHGKIGVIFNQPMVPASVEAHFSIEPHVAGEFSWDWNTLWFTPTEPLDPGQTYQASIVPGAQAENGRKLRQSIEWLVKIREVDLLYLVLGTEGGDLWHYEFATGQTYAITETGQALIDFKPSPTGDRIAYAQHNPQGGTDLWSVERDGSDPEMLVDCGKDQCDQLAWSVGADWIAYTRESWDERAERYLPSRVWTVNTRNGASTPLYRQEEAYGHSPSFSPDGLRLATYDSLQQAIRILELESSQESAIPTLYPGVGSWSPDGKELIFIDLVTSVLEPNVAIYIVNFSNQTVRNALGEFVPNLDFDPPQWSPDGKWLAYSARPVGAAINKGLWVAELDGDAPIALTDDPAATFTNYRWDPRGERLVFQRFQLSGGSSHASLWLWERSTGQIRRLVEDGARPEWLP